MAFRKRPIHAATLADVSIATGVSVAAASMVLNGRSASRIPLQTRQRILAAAKKLGYRPNLAARGLANRRLNTLGVAAVVQNGELSLEFLEVFSGIVNAAACRQQNTSVFTLQDWSCDGSPLHRFCDGRIDGLILCAPTFAPSQITLPTHTPIVSIHSRHILPGVTNIDCDEEEGVFALVQHLIACGHRKLLHLAGPTKHASFNRRHHGYLRALAHAGIPFDRDLLVTGLATADSARSAMRTWLAAHRPPDAVFCANDPVAIGCLEAIAEAGLRVPDDLSLAGFDDSVAARSIIPPLTTVSLPRQEMGRRAVELLLAQVDRPLGEKDELPVSIFIPAELVLRPSVNIRRAHRNRRVR